ncbi:hypothetical protein NQ317_017544 [Molorchus minor]|uniref:Uncharacterized protein n=1 Tax=Molorchus minor TaxID=1323400 RepID=A0ABQ9IR02_9CUCU|nr:hypothetical protein NQ317_017544 [Molorchus minor]
MDDFVSRSIQVPFTLLYGAEIWWGSMEFRTYQELLKKKQRKVLLGATGTYLMTATVALQVLAGIPPLDLLAEERGGCMGGTYN